MVKELKKILEKRSLQVSPKALDFNYHHFLFVAKSNITLLTENPVGIVKSWRDCDGKATPIEHTRVVRVGRCVPDG